MSLLLLPLLFCYQTVKSNPQLFGIDKARLHPFEKWVLLLEGQLLEGMLYQVYNNTRAGLLFFSLLFLLFSL